VEAGDAGLGSADPPHGDDGDAAARADLPAGRRAVTTLDAAQHDVHAAIEGTDEEAHDSPEGDAEVPEADRRGQEGRRHEEADRTESRDHEEAHDGAQGTDEEAHDDSEVPEADRRGQEGRRDAEAPDRAGQEGVVPEAHRPARQVGLVATRGVLRSPDRDDHVRHAGDEDALALREVLGDALGAEPCLLHGSVRKAHGDVVVRHAVQVEGAHLEDDRLLLAEHPASVPSGRSCDGR
jgi:hypothetical protein